MISTGEEIWTGSQMVICVNNGMTRTLDENKKEPFTVDGRRLPLIAQEERRLASLLPTASCEVDSGTSLSSTGWLSLPVTTC